MVKGCHDLQSNWECFKTAQCRIALAVAGTHPCEMLQCAMGIFLIKIEDSQRV